MAAVSLAFRLQELSRRLVDQGRQIATAESCTGGLLAGALTDLPDASKTFVGGVVAYATDRKRNLLDIPAEVLKREGAVSAVTAALMAGAARRLFSTEVGIGVTGVAGPSGQEGKPPGLVYLAVSAGDREVRRELHFNGGRGANRLAAVEAAVDLAIEALDGK